MLAALSAIEKQPGPTNHYAQKGISFLQYTSYLCYKPPPAFELTRVSQPQNITCT